MRKKYIIWLIWFYFEFMNEWLPCVIGRSPCIAWYILPLQMKLSRLHGNLSRGGLRHRQGTFALGEAIFKLSNIQLWVIFSLGRLVLFSWLAMLMARFITATALAFMEDSKVQLVWQAMIVITYCGNALWILATLWQRVVVSANQFTVSLTCDTSTTHCENPTTRCKISHNVLWKSQRVVAIRYDHNGWQ